MLTLPPPTPGATVYLIGAGGCGMSGLGHLLLDLGYHVAGSDLVENTELEQLRARGAIIHQGHLADNLAAARPVLVVYSSAIRLQNSELQLAQQLQIPIVRRAVLLAALVTRQRGVCIAGMHGKTTTTALLAFALENLNANPSYAIGALVPQLRRHARFETGAGTQDTLKRELQTADTLKRELQTEDTLKHELQTRTACPRISDPLFVAEADESDGTLREFQPEYAIILNIDEEHLDFYANLEAICSAFRQFAEQTRHAVIFCADDPRLAQLLAGHPRAISYGFSPLATYRLVLAEKPVLPSAPDFTSHFEVWHNHQKLGAFSLALLGEQNISNAGAVIALLHQLGYAPEKIAPALASFRGAARRQQELFRDGQVRIFDDYGHHPAEIEATLRAFKRLGPRRLLVAFQPHRFTRTHFLLKQFSTAFKAADKLWITEIYAASEPAIAGINGALLAKAVESQGQPVEFIPSLTDLRQAVRAALQPGDLVLFLGAGDITKAAHDLAAELRCSPSVASVQSVVNSPRV